MAEAKLEAPPALPVYYMKMTQANADARLGKLAPGDIRPMDAAKATRYLMAGVAEQTSEAEYREKEQRKSEKAGATRNAFQAQQEGHALWDVATYRDVLTAPEGGLRLAHERGIPLVNVHMLRDEDGDPLPPDADIDDILDARALLHPDLMSPLASHDRSSVMGGGSPYVNNVTGMGSPMPLSPQHRATMERVAEQERMAQRPAAFSYDRENPGAKPPSPDDPEASGNSEREGRAARRSQSRNAPTRAPNPPAPPISPDAAGAAEDAGVVAPSNDLKPEQRA